MIDQQSHGNPANLTYNILTGMGAMANMTAQLANITPPMLHFIKKFLTEHRQKLIVLPLTVHLSRLPRDMKKNMPNL